jgi:hypothetical protein
MSSSNWNAFGQEFASCLNDIEKDFMALPRWQRMYFHRLIRKAAREETLRENIAKQQQKTSQKRKSNNQNLKKWTPRK